MGYMGLKQKLPLIFWGDGNEKKITLETLETLKEWTR